MDEPMGQRIQRAREAAGKSEAWLADQLGVSVSTIKRWESGTVMPPRTRLDRLRQVLNLGPEPPPEAVAEPIRLYALPKIPLYALGHIAGTTDAEPEKVDDIEVPPPLGAEADAAFVIHGTSMEPSFLQGDIVGVELQASAEPGQLIIALADGELTFKRYGRAANGKAILYPLNEEGHHPMVPDEIDIRGIYRWLLRRSKDGKV